jgi:hypothetical protein
VKEVISDFNKLAEYVDASDLPYKEAVIEYYRELGEKNKFTVRKDSSVIKYGINFGKIDLIWLEPNITFTIEFGGFEEILKHLWRIIEFSPSLSVLLLSSKSGCRAADVAKLIKNSPLLAPMKDRFMILDLTDEELVE